MKPAPLDALIELSKGNASGARLAKRLGSAQQTVSRWLRTLENENLVSRTSTGYSISEKGRQHVRSLFSANPAMLKGRVVSGLGEGRYYLSNRRYEDQAKKLLGFKPFPGTLNLKLDAKSTEENARLLKNAQTTLKGFTEGKRTFGDAACYPATIAGRISGAVIAPSRSHHSRDTAELLAPVNLRKALGLKDGDAVHFQPLDFE